MKRAIEISAFYSIFFVLLFATAVPETAFASTVVDSFDIASGWGNIPLQTTQPAIGQSFTGDGSTLDSAQFYINSVGTPPGNAVATIYAHSGTFGTNSLPTGSPLATSDPVVATSISTSFQWTTFTFSGANRITLTNGTHYVLMLEYSAGSGSNHLNINNAVGIPTPASHPGNFVGEHSNGTYFAVYYEDTGFYVYGTGGTPPSDSCTYSGSGDWNILGSDHCFISTTNYVSGTVNLIGAGYLSLTGTISALTINLASGFSVFRNNATGVFSTHL